MEKAQVIQLKPHTYQYEALMAKERFVALISGIQGGKTWTGALWTRLQMDKFPLGDGAIIAPTYKILQQSTLPKFFEMNPDYQRYFAKADSIINLPTGGKVFVRSADNPNSLEGMTLSWCWMDEAGQMPLDAWINIQGRLSIKQGQCLITSTPYALNWLYTDVYEKWKKGNKDYRVVQFRSVDSPYFPKEEFERVKNSMDRRIFERRYCGIFAKMDGLVFEEFELSKQVKDLNDIPEKFDLVLAGVDWGYVAPTAIIVIGINDNCFYLLDEYYETRRTHAEILEAMGLLKDTWKINRFYADSAEPDRIAEARNAGFYVLEANKNILMGLEKEKQLIRESRFLVSRKCQHFLDEMERYHYPRESEGTRTGEFPEKSDDHLMDATRYVCATHLFAPAPRVANEDERFRRNMKNYKKKHQKKKDKSGNYHFKMT